MFLRYKVPEGKMSQKLKISPGKRRKRRPFFSGKPFTPEDEDNDVSDFWFFPRAFFTTLLEADESQERTKGLLTFSSTRKRRQEEDDGEELETLSPI